MALNLAKGFGGGAGRGELCGALTSGIMALGLKYGDDSKKYIDEFQRSIEEKYGSLRCSEMLGYDVLDKEVRERSENKKRKSETCPKIVLDCISMVEEIIKSD